MNYYAIIKKKGEDTETVLSIPDDVIERKKTDLFAVMSWLIKSQKHETAYFSCPADNAEHALIQFRDAHPPLRPRVQAPELVPTA